MTETQKRNAAPEALSDDPEARWRELHSRWLRMQAEWAAGEVDEDRAHQLTMDEGPLVLAMVATPVPRRWLEQKLEVLTHVMFHNHSSSWIDRRDELLLNSIKADVKALD